MPEKCIYCGKFMKNNKKCCEESNSLREELNKISKVGAELKIRISKDMLLGLKIIWLEISCYKTFSEYIRMLLYEEISKHRYFIDENKEKFELSEFDKWLENYI